jgi:DUF1680 family protein
MALEPRYYTFDRGDVSLAPSEWAERFQVNRDYLISLNTEDLLFNYRHEAVLNVRHKTADNKMGLYDTTGFGGWESPGSQVRGHFLGHWLSAAARIIATTGDRRLNAKADYIVSELARYQEHNGNGWVGSIPEKYFEKMAKGQPSWAPQYVLHKTLMGLWEMYKLASNKQALEVLDNAADWFHRWSGQFSGEAFQDILDEYETGGMLEIWAELYDETKNKKYHDLMERYERKRFNKALLDGKDVLSDKHANTIIPEIYGCARAYEVTGEEKLHAVTEKFWHDVVPTRMYSTGGHTHRELWSYPNQLADTLVDGIRSNQEFCTVYNMMWLTKYLLRWSGDPQYADYYERNLFNGILSGLNPETGTITYYHPFKPGGKKRWDSRTQHFWCCHGTGVQSMAELPNVIYFHHGKELLVNLFIPSRVIWSVDGKDVVVSQVTDFAMEDIAEFHIDVEEAMEFDLTLRIPWWVGRECRVEVNGELQSENLQPSSHHTIRRQWQKGDTVRLHLPMYLHACPLPDDPETFSVMYGPLVLAAISEGEVHVQGTSSDVEDLVTPDRDRKLRFSLASKDGRVDMMPLHEVFNEPFAIYLRASKY